MEDVRQWLESYKKQLILAGVAAMVLAPFLWPFFLAIIYNALFLAVLFQFYFRCSVSQFR